MTVKDLMIALATHPADLEVAYHLESATNASYDRFVMIEKVDEVDFGHLIVLEGTKVWK